MTGKDLLFPLLAYVLGSIPFGILFSIGFRGIDPRTSGSGNMGFTNVLRVAGPLPGLLTLSGDMGKGYLAVRTAQAFSQPETLVWIAGLCAVLGHNYSLFLAMKGGKGVATAFGVFLGLNLNLGLSLLGLWGVTVLIWRYSSLGAITAFLCLPFLTSLFLDRPDTFFIAFLISALILLKHSGNMKRLRAGTEPKIGGSS